MKFFKRTVLILTSLGVLTGTAIVSYRLGGRTAYNGALWSRVSEPGPVEAIEPQDRLNLYESRRMGFAFANEGDLQLEMSRNSTKTAKNDEKPQKTR